MTSLVETYFSPTDCYSIIRKYLKSQYVSTTLPFQAKTYLISRLSSYIFYSAPFSLYFIYVEF